MPVRIPVRLRSTERFLRRNHGSVRQLTVTERRIMRKWVRRMELAIEDAWPVDTGTSRDHWRSRVYGSARTNPDGGIGFLLWNDTYYVQWIRRTGEKQAGLSALWRRLVPRVIREFRDPMLAELNAEILQTEAEIKRGADLLDILQLRRSA